MVQPHRYTRLRDLFEEFCTCFNDADVVIVADVYAAGEAPIEGVDRDALVEGLRARGHAGRWRSKRPDELAGLIARRPGRATTSSASAPATSRLGLRPAGRTCGGRGERPVAGMMAAETLAAPDRSLPPVRGRLPPTSRWRPSPGSASAARPRCCSCRQDEDDLAYFLRDLPAESRSRCSASAPT